MNTSIHAERADAYEIAAQWCVRLVEGALSEADREAFGAWLQEDVYNRDVFDSVAAGWDSIGEIAEEPELQALRDQASRDLRAAKQRRRSPFFQARGVILSIAASLVLAFAVGLGWQLQRPTVYGTGVGERQVVMLDDGSSVSLDGDTEVRVKYSDGQRQLWLTRGRARFNVSKDPLRPFSVTADDKVVVATGTSFSVERVANQVRVALFEGTVAILDAGAQRRLGATGSTPRAGETRLRANEEMVLQPGRQPDTAPVLRLDPVRAASWEGGFLTFEAEPLALAAERMNRYADVPITIDPSASTIEVSGVFRAGDTAAFVEGVTAVLPVTAKSRDGRTELRATTR